jgi:glycosyltransferase involved in cell wall biosynthesis
MVHADFMLSVLHLVQQARADGQRISIVNSKASIVTQARNLAVQAALEARAEWLMFLDSDMVFPPNTVSRLLAHGHAIVGATYPRKSWPLAYIGTRLDGTPLSLADAGLVEAARLPAGCLLIRATVFDQLQRPYFRCAYDEATGLVLGEDFWFSDLVRSCGFTLWCDMTLSRQIGHLGLHRFVHKDDPAR